MKSDKTFLVTSISGKQLPRSSCRYINKEYYEINVDCFYMPDQRWHRVNNGKIEFDHELQSYVLIDRTDLSYGIVGITSDGTIKTGYFSKNRFKNIYLNDNVCMNDSIIQNISVKGRSANSL